MCSCISALRKSWLCNEHRVELVEEIREENGVVEEFMRGVGGRGREDWCPGCFTNMGNENTMAWGCRCCREWVVSSW